MLTATQVHQAVDLFGEKGEFPIPKYVDFKLSKEAERYYKTGPAFLRRYLSFWLAIFIDRTKIMLVPFER